MNRNAFLDFVTDRTTTRTQLLRSKGAAYSGDADAFANFKRNAEKLGLTKYQIWSVYCGKHLDAIFGAIKRNPVRPVDSSEGLPGRIDDTINYLDLLAGMDFEEYVSDERPTQLRPLPSNDDIAAQIVNLMGGNGLSTEQSRQHIKDLLDAFYGPRHFSM